MSDTALDPLVIDAINQTQQAVMDSQVVRTGGAGKAYQMVAQSCALAIQDAADNLRNMNTIASTAIGVAMAQYLSTGDQKYMVVLTEAQSLLTAATQNFQAVGEAAAGVLKQFPSS
jgi:precorrin isomerase